MDPDTKLHEVVVTRRTRCRIGDRQIVLEPGETLLLAGDVKRALQDRGVLDPVCLEAE